MRVTLLIEHKETNRRSRRKLDLYEETQVERTCQEVGEKLRLRGDLLETDLSKLTDLLESYRNKELLNEEKEEKKIFLPVTISKTCKEFLAEPNLLTRINELIEKGGVVGEVNNRLFLFIVASSYKMTEPLNALLQGSSGSGKTHLLNRILNFMPSEDVIFVTRITEKSLYNFPEEYLNHKVLGLEDLDGLKEEVFLAFRELQSRGQLTSSISARDKDGNIISKIKKVKGSIASISATTKGQVYEDNMSRCFLLAVDESDEQTDRIVEYQNKKNAGKISKQEEIEAQQLLQNCIRTLQPLEVVNPFAELISLPREVHKIRRLNQLYQALVKQITILHQFQRKKDSEGRLITQKEDLQAACDIMLSSIIMKTDELDGSLRVFYENLKAWIKNQVGQKEVEAEVYLNHSFTQREVRQSLRQSKSQIQRYFSDLIELEYIRQVSKPISGYKYRIIHWDDISNIKERTRNHLYDQLSKL